MSKSVRENKRVPDAIDLSFSGSAAMPQQEVSKEPTQKKGPADAIDMSFDGDLKKKDTLLGSSAPSSTLQSQQAQVGNTIASAPVDNTPKPKTREDYFKGIKDVVSNNYADLDVSAKKSNINLKQVVMTAEKGNAESLVTLRKLVAANFDKKISESTTPSNFSAFSTGGFGQPIQSVTSGKNANQVKLEQEKNAALKSLNEFGSVALTNDHKKVAGNNIDKIDFVALGRDHQKYFGEEEETRQQQLAQKSKLGIAKIAKDNINFNYASIGVGNAIHDEEMTYNELKEAVKKDPTLAPKLEESKNQLNKLYDKQKNLFNEYPEVRKQYVAQVLGDKIAEQNKAFNLYVSKDDIIKAADAIEKEHGAKLPANFKSDVNSLMDETGGFFGNTSPVPGQGFKGAMDRAAVGTGLGIYGLLHIGSEEDRAARKVALQSMAFNKGTSESGATKEVMTISDDGKTYIPKNNEENFHHFNPLDNPAAAFNNYMRVAGGAVPMVAEFMATEAVTGGIGGVIAGIGEAAAAPVALVDAGVAANIAQKFAFSEKTMEVAKKAASFFVTGFDENHDRSSELIKGEGIVADTKRNAMAAGLTMLDMLSFELVGTNVSQIVKGSIKKAVAKDLAEHIEKVGVEGLTSKSTFIDPLIKSYVPRLVTALGKEGAKMGVATAVQTALKDMASIAADPNHKMTPVSEYADIVTESAITGIALGLPGHVWNTESKTLNSLNRDALFDAAQNSDKYIRKYNQAVVDGKMTRQQANEAIKVVNTAKAEYNNRENRVDKNGKPLNDSKVKKIIADRFLQRATELVEDKAERNKLRESTQKRIDEIKASEDWVNINETPLIKEMGIRTIGDGRQSYAVDKIEDIDPAADYIISGEKGKKTGAEVIDMIEKKAQNYKHEEAKTSEGEETPDQKAAREKAESEASQSKVTFTGKDNNFLANTEPNFFTPEEREKYNELMKTPETADEAADMVSKRKEELRNQKNTPIEIEDKDLMFKYGEAEGFIIDGTARKEVRGVMEKMNDAEYINENEMDKAANNLYDLLDKHGDNPSFANLIEPLINKIEKYEFRTKTETSTVTEREAVQVAKENNRRKAVSKDLNQWEGSTATITDSNGKEVTGQIKMDDGKYYLFDAEGNKVAVIGEAALTDRDSSLPPTEEMPSPFEIGEDGQIKSITLQLNKVDTENGGLKPDKRIKIEFKDPEKALDLAIQLQAEAVGEYPMEEFETQYREIQKEIKKEVLVSEAKEKEEREKKTKELEVERDQKILSESVPDHNFDFIPDTELAKMDGDVELKATQDRLKNRAKQLENLIKCLELMKKN